MQKKRIEEYNLATVNSELAKEWHPTKNGALRPQEVSEQSHKKVWWKCEKGHEWEATITDRSRGTGCPYCSGKKVIKGENDLATINQELAKEWHPTKNGALRPQEVSEQSHKKVWWKCEKGHEWEETITNRSRGTGCPYCSGKKVIKGETDLATINQDLAKEWHPTKNGALRPQEVSEQSHKKVWWKCEKGHEWEATITNRSRGTGCPYCSGKKVIEGETDLATINQDLAKEWHPTKNGALRPQEVSEQSHKKVWWKCEKGHEWEATVGSRSNGAGCPYCAGLKVIEGETDLATINSELAKEWHPTKNGALRPQEISSQSNKKVWWKCEKGHEWEATVGSRSNGAGCPYCAGLKVIEGETDLATINQELAKEWHPTKNGALRPQEVSEQSHKKVWWKCEKGHEWRATIASRSVGSGCPKCQRDR